jgi:hypothetical protein
MEAASIRTGSLGDCMKILRHRFADVWSIPAWKWFSATLTTNGISCPGGGWRRTKAFTACS